jgi:beta-phosphoglucomutase-like phosphatase (HAD superfamily)
MKKRYAIFDMDGTLSDASRRQHHLLKEPKDWDGFFGDLHADAPIREIVSLYNELCASNTYDVAIFTGRPEKYRKMTEEWMLRHGLTPRPIHCRKDGDFRHDLIVKREIYDAFLKEGNEIAFIVEDRNSVVAMWREMGVVCLHCFDGNF